MEWTWQDLTRNGDWRIPPDPHSKDEWHVDVDFNPDYNNTFGTPSTFDYVIKIADRSLAYPNYPNTIPAPAPGNEFFEDVKLVVASSNATGTIPSVVDKYVYEAIFNPSLNDYQPGALIKKLSVTGGGSDMYSFIKDYDILYIKDVATPNDGVIDNYSNQYLQREIPGPLPVLGASLALGSVRKLRNLTSRLKVHSLG